MKKILLVISVLLIAVVPASAEFFIDGRVDYMSTGEFKSILGGGGALGFSISDDVSFVAGGFVAQNKENAGLDNQLMYEFSAFLAGIEYIPPIEYIDLYRIKWKNSISFGYSSFEAEQEIPGSPDSIEIREGGFITSFKTGIQYSFTQTISPFFDLGYHKTFYPENVKISVAGWQTAIGVRLYFGGSRDFNSNY